MAHQPPGTLLAAEDASFTVTHDTIVRYGNDTTFFKQLFAAGTYVCSNTTFGGDPTPFVVKDCEVAIPPLIDAAAISYALSFPDETATAVRKLPVDATSYALTNAATTLQAARKLAVDANSYALTSSAETAVAARMLAVDAAGYAVTPAAVTLTYTSPSARTLAVEPVSYGIEPGNVILTYVGGVQYLGGGSSRRKNSRQESYLDRLLGRPLNERFPEVEQDQIEAIEQAAEVAAEAPQSPTQEDAAEALRLYGIALKDAYVQIYLELEQSKRQQREDEEIAAVIAAVL